MADIPAEVKKEADKAAAEFLKALATEIETTGEAKKPGILPEHFARAILAAEERATQRERERCAADAAIQEALLESQYKAGFKAGWNAALSDDGGEKAERALSYEGHLKPFKERTAIMQKENSNAG